MSPGAALRAAGGKLADAREALSPAEWRRMLAMGSVVAALFGLGWALLLGAASGHYHLSRTSVFGVGTGVLALTFGMRHAFDADHIAAIDSTTRKLMADKKRPLGVGFWFSLGHSTVVMLLAVALNFGIRALDDQVRSNQSGLHQVANVIGTGVSGGFLFLIAALNVVILVSIARMLRAARKGAFSEDELQTALDKRGLMNRFLGGLARRIDSPWKMYPIGVLFGLGFDTATEVALLVLSSTAVVSGLPFYAVLSLPLLFAAGMSFFDLLDGCFMNFAYGWAFSSPMRKIYYNLVITGLSVGVAVLIGAVEVSSLIGQELNFSGPVFSSLQGLNINTMGFVVVGVFAITWAGALAYWKLGRVEERWESDAARARFEAALTPGDDRLAQRNSADGKGSLPIAEPALARPGF